MLLGRTLCRLMEQLRPKTGNPLEICFGLSMLLLLLCISNVSRQYYHDTGSDQLYAKHKGGMVSVAWDHGVSSHGAATA